MSLANPLSFRRRRRVEDAVQPLQKHGFPTSVLDRLADFVLKAEDRDLYYANPRYLAQRLALDERTTLRLLVAGVAEGLFSLGWRVSCPACAMRGNAVLALGDLPAEVTCRECGHDFATHLDEEISVAISATGSLRSLTRKQGDDPQFRAEVDQRLGTVSALTLINVPSFRHLVATQVLPEGQYLGVNRLAIFFSDLRRSTDFYHRRGDAEAYHWVSEHFKLMFAAVERHGGTAVKTIGDGIMGTFAGPAPALQAIAEGNQALRELNQEANLTGEDRLSLKVGLNVGPCIVVTLNGRLDYFGEAVNVAARLDALATGEEILLGEAVVADEETATLAQQLGELQPLSAELRGIPGRQRIFRLLLENSD